MRAGGNNFHRFPENKLTKLANLVQFKRIPMSCLKDWGPGFSRPLVYGTASKSALSFRSRRCCCCGWWWWWFHVEWLQYNTLLRNPAIYVYALTVCGTEMI